jgi:ribosomal protein S18 acetylase RimI-like enzyme
MNSSLFKFTPWDSIIFGMDTYEVLNLSSSVLETINQQPGHYTARIDPIASKKILHEHLFYYCDTLIEPYCDRHHLICFEDKNITIYPSNALDKLLETCENSFVHGRFHRDFNIPKERAEKRYAEWIKQLHESKSVYELRYNQDTAGFIGFDNSKLVLHALNTKYRGKGLAKYFWSSVCNALFDQSNNELTSSVSAANLSAINLYASLGFRFRNPMDIYHRLVL